MEESAGKRTVQINVKMNAEDFSLLQRAAQKLWPEAIISNSGIVLGLAKLAAKQTLSPQKLNKSGRKNH
jgi:uncharacterized protein (DUF1778 family)